MGMQTGMVCSRWTPGAGSRPGGGRRARQRQPASRAGRRCVRASGRGA